MVPRLATLFEEHPQTMLAIKRLFVSVMLAEILCPSRNVSIRLRNRNNTCLAQVEELVVIEPLSRIDLTETKFPHSTVNQ